MEYGIAVAQRIKGTLGITGLSCPRVHIDGKVWHLDVGSSHPGGGEAPKGPAVRRLKWYVSWVQNVDNTAFLRSNPKLVSAYFGGALTWVRTPCG